jgi:hypothetical protein
VRESDISQWADAIVGLFPHESREVYFIPYNRGPPKSAAKGKLVNRIANLKRSIKAAEATKTPTSSSASKLGKPIGSNENVFKIKFSQLVSNSASYSPVCI